MPYIKERDKKTLEPYIAELEKAAVCKIVADVGRNKQNTHVFPHQCVAVCFEHIALELLEGLAFKSAAQAGDYRMWRYKLLAKTRAIIGDVLFELKDRILSKSPIPYNFEISLAQGLRLTPSDHREFWPPPPGLSFAIQQLQVAIGKITGKDGHNDPDSFLGLGNYSLTTLMPRILMGVYKEFHKPFGWNAAFFLAQFWWSLYNEFYIRRTRPYEDEQIEKNGDVEIYGRMLELLGETG